MNFTSQGQIEKKYLKKKIGQRRLIKVIIVSSSLGTRGNTAYAILNYIFWQETRDWRKDYFWYSNSIFHPDTAALWLATQEEDVFTIRKNIGLHLVRGFRKSETRSELPQNMKKIPQIWEKFFKNLISFSQKFSFCWKSKFDLITPGNGKIYSFRSKFSRNLAKLWIKFV